MGLLQRSEQILCPGVFFRWIRSLTAPEAVVNLEFGLDLGLAPNSKPNQFYHSVIVLLRCENFKKRNKKLIHLCISSEQKKIITPFFSNKESSGPPPNEWTFHLSPPQNKKIDGLDPTLHTPRVHPHSSAAGNPNQTGRRLRVFFHPFFSVVTI